MSNNDNDRVLFVFYTINPSSTKNTWTYGKFPKGWSWTGRGSTSAVGAKPLKYQREEQFNGPKENIEIMKKYLDNYFNKLKENNIITIYKIRKSYKP